MKEWVLGSYGLAIVIWGALYHFSAHNYAFEIFTGVSLAALKSIVSYQLKKDSHKPDTELFFKKNLLGGILADALLFLCPLGVMIWLLLPHGDVKTLVFFSFGFYFLLLTVEVFLYYKTSLHFTSGENNVFK